jgi:hypothetical protein
MAFWPHLKSAFRNLLGKPRVGDLLEGDPLEDELRAYVDMVADERIAAARASKVDPMLALRAE